MINERLNSLKFKEKCNSKILSTHTIEQIEAGLVDLALDGYIESLKNENPNISEEEINSKLKELVIWKKSLQKTSTIIRRGEINGKSGSCSHNTRRHCSSR
jgi:predicted metal-dependent hydrolase